MTAKMRHVMKYFYSLLILFSGIIGLFSCSNGPTNTKQGQINKNIVLLEDCCHRPDDTLAAGYAMAAWRNQSVFVGPLVKLTLGDSLIIVKTNQIWKNIDFFTDTRGVGSFLTSDAKGTKILLVKTSYGDISMGSLYEYDIGVNNLFSIKDSTYCISSAVYWHNDDNKLVYYSYGSERGCRPGLKAGYYLYNKTTNKDSLLLAYESPAGPSEMLNGFDLSPDNTKLLVPLVQATPLTIHPPLVGIYHLQTQTMDTLKVHFDQSFDREGLWLRYNSDGSRILYCNFPHGVFGYTTNDDSQVGIIEMPSQTKRVLDVNTYTGGRSVQLAPTWGPNDQNIIYGSAPLAMPSGAKGKYSLYILKNVNDPDNYIK